jgi:hypothetical protein
MKLATGVLSLAMVFIPVQRAFAEHPKAPVKITNGPVIESVFDDHAVIAWSTNAPASTTLKYGTDQNNLNQQAQAPWGGTPHRVTMKSLQPNTTYYFKVIDANAQGTGTSAESPVYSLTTVAKGASPQTENKNVGVLGEGSSTDSAMAVRITNGPVIESVFDDKAVIAWSTNAKSGATLKYGTDQSNLNEHVQAGWGESPHRVTVKNLQSNTTYYFKLIDTNAQHTGTNVESPVYSFKTVAKGAAPQRENKNVGVQGQSTASK